MDSFLSVVGRLAALPVFSLGGLEMDTFKLTQITKAFWRAEGNID